MPAIIKYLKTANNLGGPVTENELLSASFGALLDNTKSAEAAAGKTEYACIYIKNTGDSLAEVVKQWLLSNTPSEDTEDSIGVGASGVNGEEQVVADKNTAPVGVVFGLASTEAGCLNYPDLNPGDFHALWLRRVTSPNAAPIALDNSVFRTKVDTI